MCSLSVSCNGKTNCNNRCNSVFSELDKFFSNLLRSLIPFMQAMNRNSFSDTNPEEKKAVMCYQFINLCLPFLEK